MTAVITLLILAAFLLAGGFYTYVITTKTMNESLSSVRRGMDLALSDRLDRDTDDPVIRKAYGCWTREYLNNHDDIGFYGMLDLGEGKIVEHEDYLSVYYENAENGKFRIIPVGLDFRLPDDGDATCYLHHAVVDGMCDDNYVFDGTIEFNSYLGGKEYTYEYHFGSSELVSAADAVPVSEWAGTGDFYDLVYHQCAATRSEAKLNAEAKALLSKYIAEWESKGYSPASQQRFGTSYYISYRKVDSVSANLYAVYLFHPLKMAVIETCCFGFGNCVCILRAFFSDRQSIGQHSRIVQTCNCGDCKSSRDSRQCLCRDIIILTYLCTSQAVDTFAR